MSTLAFLSTQPSNLHLWTLEGYKDPVLQSLVDNVSFQFDANDLCGKLILQIICEHMEGRVTTLYTCVLSSQWVLMEGTQKLPDIAFSFGSKHSFLHFLPLSDLIKQSQVVRVSIPITAHCTWRLPHMQTVCKQASSCLTLSNPCPYLPTTSCQMSTRWFLIS